MTSIEFNDVCVDFAIYNASGRSFKKKILQVATGGKIGVDDSGQVIVRALEGLSLSIRNGEKVGLLGHNGAGKSTLLRLLGKVYEPSSGTARIEGKVGSLMDISLGIDPEASGRENIFVRGALLGISRLEMKQKIDEIIEFSELGDFIDMPLRTYSLGMNLRLAFAVSTIVRPEILLMDEWLSVGDEGFKHRCEQRMSEIVRSTNILIIASHSRDLLLRTCNRVIWLECGRIKMDGDPQAITQMYFGNAEAR